MDEKRVALFVDVQNIYYTTRQVFNSHFDYNAFWALVSKGRQVTKAIAYAIDRGDPRQRQFQDILRAIGFEVKLKPFIQRSDGTAKGDWDVGITLDVMSWAPKVDMVALASGDGDFDLLLQKVRQDFGLHTEVYGVEALTASSLIQVSDHFIPITHDLLLPIRKTKKNSQEDVTNTI
ncbi:NYN domain-containing protein [Endozoicomonas sp. SCSIO W0465]|uniref:LabA-like NYN domain-containing protein n=1 Tax=Endozoicomonas sp. SCSIO W0465 TaxID=2918516 RepID=UPI002075F8BE|nr:NYN domain-containing protein [Endozoicomonas sp. SCSIO W0465]USE37901.1 NYN domain-containing protein [Endozoicomonas sp. SCSIO W0465]